jgi:penicillin-binding protein 1C
MFSGNLPGLPKARWLRRLLAGIAGSCVLAGLSFIVDPPPSPKPYSPVVLDRNGEFLHAFLARDGMWRLRTDPEQIPSRLRDILLRKEDRWFAFHPGVNPFALARAIVQNVKSGRVVSGGSTITMQIARMLEPKERTYWNKIREVLRAFQLELKYSKKELLEMYLSMVPLGGNVEGIQSAALLYYQTPLERLNIAQLIDLTLIPGDPQGLQPDRNGPSLFRARTELASRWLRAGILQPSDSVVVWQTPAAIERRAPVRRAPHFALRVKNSAGTETEIRSSLDLGIQTTVEALLSQHLRGWKPRGIQNGAVLVVENECRGVRAYAGSENFEDAGASGQVDGVRAIRSPGSTLKPLLYALEMEHGDLTPKSHLLDVPYDAEGFQAENYDGTYSGTVFADEALQRSLNVPMVRVLKNRGLPEFLDFLCRLGMSSLASRRNQLGLSMILGGCGVTLEELVRAYAAFPAGGMEQELALGAADDGERVQARVFSPATAYMVTEILTGLQRPDLPSNFESTLHLSTVAFKTGTSYGRRDAWAIGYTGDFTVGVWVGNPDNRGNPDIVGGKVATPLLIDILNAVASRNRKKILALPPEVGVRTVCAVSGLTPTPQCSHQITDLYAVRTTNLRSCDLCREYLISPDGRRTYCASCLGNAGFRRAFFVDAAPELMHFWQAAGIRHEVPPPHNPACPRVFPGDGPAIVSPTRETTYFLVHPGQELALLAGSAGDVRAHSWYLDDRFLGSRPPGDKFFVTVAEGIHAITCVDDHGRATKIQITVKSAL